MHRFDKYKLTSFILFYQSVRFSFGFEMEEPEIISGGDQNDSSTSSSSAADEWEEKMQIFHKHILAVLGMVDRKKVFRLNL